MNAGRKSLLFLIIFGLLVILPGQARADTPKGNEINLDESDNGRHVELGKDQTLVLSLAGNPSAGYFWLIENESQVANVLRQQGQSVFKSEGELHAGSGQPLLGGPGRQVLRFEPAAAGQVDLKLVYRRPWEEETGPAKTFSVRVQAAKPENRLTAPPTPAPKAPDSPAELDSSLLGLPSSFNWCDQGKCTPVKDQNPCGTCWAFGTVGVLESSIKIQDGITRDLSEQYLISCNMEGWNCLSGGWWTAHDYHKDKIPSGEPAAGAVYETDFPYVTTNVACNPPHTHHETLVDWSYITNGWSIPSVAEIKQAIYTYGPVGASVCSGDAFGHYSSGVFQTDESAFCQGNTNHAIVLVGWDDSTGTWRLRNSWGPNWGENGYMNIKYGVSNIGYAANYVVYGGGQTCLDGFEADNSFTTANAIYVNGSSQSHNFHTASDVDWLYFTAQAGTTYNIATANLGANNDTVLSLYDTNGSTQLKSNDDCAGKESCITNWVAPQNGDYYIQVSNYANKGGCDGYDYQVRVTADKEFSYLHLPALLKSNANCQETQLVQNTGFESGQAPWVEVVANYSIVGQYWTHSGLWSAWLGGYENADDRLYQSLTMPSGVTSAQLKLYLYVYSEDIPTYPYDYFHVELQDASGATLDDFLWADNRMDSDEWYVGTVTWNDFSAHTGQQRRLFFQGTTDYSLNTNYFVDDVTFWTYCSSPLTGQPPDGLQWDWQKLESPPDHLSGSMGPEGRK